ncbi:MAG TPA: C45 family peptidase [Hyphomicrobiaceae bacterium]
MSTDVCSRLAVIGLSGTPYEVGLQLGRFGADVVRGHIVRTHAWASVMAFRDHPNLAAARELVATQFPRYWQEIRGLAHGLELPLEDVFAWNCRGDVWAMAPDGCTTLQIPGQPSILAHNEDGDPGLKNRCAVAIIRAEGGRAFTAFVYPGSIPGHAFAVNEAGLVQTVNNIRARSGTKIGVPRMVLTRAMLDCSSIEQAVDLLDRSERWGAFHLSLTQRGFPYILSIEFTRSKCSVRQIDQPSCHANHLIHDATAGEDQIVTASSRSRQERGDEVLRLTCQKRPDPLAILWDKAKPTLPLYREQPDDPDGENTIATALFEVHPHRVSWRIFDRAYTSAILCCDDGYEPCRPHLA